MKNWGLNLISLIGIILVLLKLTGYISWSWWIVTLPFWIGGLFILFVGILLIGSYIQRRRRYKELRKDKWLP